MRTNHFNWSYLFDDKRPENFLAGDGTLWGEGQGIDNPGRIEWLKIGNQLRSTTRDKKEITIGELGIGAGVDIQMWKANGLLTPRPDMPSIKYYGLDVTPEFCQLAASRHPEITVTLIDGYNIPYTDNFFDYFYLRHVLEHQENYRWQMREIFRTTKENIIINFFIPLTDNDNDEISFDNVFYHNRYSKQLFYRFCNKYGWGEAKTITFKTENSTDELVILSRLERKISCFVET